MTGSRQGTKWHIWVVVSLATVVVVMIAIWSADDGVQEPHPTPDFVVTSRELRWTGGFCVHLEQWSNGDWRGVGSSGYVDASAGNWGRFDPSAEFCQPAEVLEGSVMLPPDTDAGVYRICGLKESDCLEFTYEPNE